MIYTSRYESPLGGILLAGDQEGLTGLWFTEGSRYVGQGLARDAVHRETEYFDQTKKWLDIYFSGRNPGFLPKIHLVGSIFVTVSGRSCVRSHTEKQSHTDGLRTK